MKITSAMLVLGLFDKAERPLLPNAAGPVTDGYGDYDAAASKGLSVTLYNDATCTGGKFEGWYVEGVCYSTQGNHGMHVQNTRHNDCSRKLPRSHLLPILVRWKRGRKQC